MEDRQRLESGESPSKGSDGTGDVVEELAELSLDCPELGLCLQRTSVALTSELPHWSHPLFVLLDLVDIVVFSELPQLGGSVSDDRLCDGHALVF